jgi:uncharacterized protein YbjT (DUF2867 family)
MKILVIGGTGNVGSEVLKQLVEGRNVELRALVRKEGASLPKGVEPFVGDLLDPVSVEKALTGVDKLYLLNAVTPDELTQGLIAYGLARKLNIKHIVYHSVFKVEAFKNVPHFASKLAIESALRQFDVPFTVIRPTYSSRTTLTETGAAGRGIYPTPLGNPRHLRCGRAWRKRPDAHEPGIRGKTLYSKNGPEVPSGPKMQSLSAGLGKKIPIQ